MIHCISTGEKCVDYNKYLKSEHWKNIKNDLKLIKEEKNEYHCHICNSTETLNIHHLTYYNIGKEDFSDLIILCNKCHFSIHSAMQRYYENNEIVINLDTRLAKHELNAISKINKKVLKKFKSTLKKSIFKTDDINIKKLREELNGSPIDI